VYGNPVDGPIQYLVDALTLINRNFGYPLRPDHKLLLNKLLVPFKLLAMRSAQQVPRTASGSSLRHLPKDMCRMVGGMFV
jgi:hypothetical protein